MYKKQRLISIVLMALAITAFSGCEKIKDVIIKPKTDIVDCRILDLGSFSGRISYNAQGNPVYVNRGGGTGTANKIFQYDSLNRLIQYDEVYSNNVREIRYLYTYDGTGKVVTEEYSTLLGLNGKTIMELDDKGRVIKSTRTGPYPGTTITTYTYDEQGNLERPGVVYDDKVNMHRTSKVFQLIDRDYSRNNPFIAEAYNKTGLPTRIPPTGKGILTFLNNVTIAGSTIRYSCE